MDKILKNMDIIQASIQLGIHLLETALQVDVLLEYFESHVSAKVTLTLIVLTLFTTNTSSAVLVYRNMVFSEGRQNGRVACIAMHVLQLGMVWRYFKLLFTRDRDDQRELTMLRLLQSTIQSAVYLVGLGFVWQSEIHLSVMSLAALCVTIASLALAYVCHEAEWRARRYFNGHLITTTTRTITTTTQSSTTTNDQHKKHNYRPVVYFSLLCLSKLFTLSTRCLAIVLVTAAAKLWIVLITFLHVTLSSVGLYILRASSKQIVGTGLKDLIVNTFHLFDLLRVYEKNLGAEVVYLRAFLFIEGVSFLLIWFFTAGTIGIHKEVILIVTLSLLTLGHLVLILETIHRHSCKFKSIQRSCMVFNICNSAGNFHRSRLKEEPSPAHQIRTHTDTGTAHSIIHHPINYMNNHENGAVGRRHQRPQTDQPGVVLTPPSINQHGHAFMADQPVTCTVDIVPPAVTSQGDPAGCDFLQVTICCGQSNLHDSGCSCGSLGGPGDLSVSNSSSSGGYNTSGISVDTSHQCYSQVTPNNTTISTSTNTIGAISDNTSTSVEFLELDFDPVYYIRPKEMDTVSMGNYRLIPEQSSPSNNNNHHPHHRQHLNTHYWDDLGYNNNKVQGRVVRNVRRFQRHSRRRSYYSSTSETASSDTIYPEYFDRPDGGRQHILSPGYALQTADSASSISTSSSYTTDTMDLIVDSDEDFTMSWPPARKITIENIKNLPTERVNPWDQVAKWLDTTAVETMHGNNSSSTPTQTGKDTAASCKHGLNMRSCSHCRLRRLDGLDCNITLNKKNKKKTTAQVKTLIRGQDKDYLRKTMYNHHRFGSPLPWASAAQRQGIKSPKKRYRLLELCCGGGTSVVTERPKALWPYNTHGLLS